VRWRQLDFVQNFEGFLKSFMDAPHGLKKSLIGSDGVLKQTNQFINEPMCLAIPLASFVCDCDELRPSANDTLEPF
jgi:hypothetical protein